MSMNLIPGIESTGSALSAEKIRLEIIAQNIANSNTTQDASGNVYKRKEVSFEEFIKTPDRRVPAYEANLTVVKTSRRLAQQALAIGR